MDKVKKGINNQAIGFLPILLFMFLDNYLSYLLSFTVSFIFCLLCVFFFQIFIKEKIYQLSLIPSGITFILYALFLLLTPDQLLYGYTPLIIEIVLVVVLSFVMITRKSIFQRIRNAPISIIKRAVIRTSVNEFYLVSQIFLFFFGFHSLFLAIYPLFPREVPNEHLDFVLYRQLPVIFGILIIVYEQIRTRLMKRNLEKEVWLPILNDKGRVIGSMAQSVSETSNLKYFHPIVRIAVLYKGMLYMVKNGKQAKVSPDHLDHPFSKYVIFRHSIEGTVRDAIGSLSLDKSIIPHFLLRYTFENEKVKTLVSLYAIRLETEEQLQHCKNGKLWTTKQIEENMQANIFSEYFVKEFPYLQNTILLAESIAHGNNH